MPLLQEEEDRQYWLPKPQEDTRLRQTTRRARRRRHSLRTSAGTVLWRTCRREDDYYCLSEGISFFKNKNLFLDDIVATREAWAWERARTVFLSPFTSVKRVFIKIIFPRRTCKIVTTGVHDHFNRNDVAIKDRILPKRQAAESRIFPILSHSFIK